ncbi:MAG: anaerobic ribonucleoside-triphosphate reductase [Candidatus Diapherotrites archaeon]|nr:anaerobic ribonucleoside-triphosphate reductase [Candidatus Diapherotrites archaeon]
MKTTEKSPKLTEDATDISLFVTTSDEELKRWDKSRMVSVLVEEANAPRDLAEQIATEVEELVTGSGLRNITTVLIRELVNAKLMEHGHSEYILGHARFGLPATDVEKLLYQAAKENANVIYSPESVHKYFGDAVAKQYTLEYLIPAKYKKPWIARAHLRGDIHIHDLDYFITRPYCAAHDLRYLAKYGLVMDGTGKKTATAKPAKQAEVLLLHAAKWLGVNQAYYSGAQAYSIFNPIVAPYLTGKTEQQIKQLAQMFVFEMAQMSVARGAQVVFSDLNLDFGVPNMIADVPAIGPGGKTAGVYGDYVEESQKFVYALLDVYEAGDSRGVPFLFPKPLFKVRKEHIGNPEFDDFMLRCAEVSSSKGNPYYINQTTYEEESIAMCCRLRHKVSEDDYDDIREGRMRSNAIQNVTINLPRLAYKARGNDDRLFEELDKVMEIAKDVHLIKRDVTQKLMEADAAPLLSMNLDGQPYLRLNKVRHLIGLLGMNELVQCHYGQEMHESEEALRFGWRVARHMDKRCKEFTEECGYPFALEQTPAESTAFRMAKLDWKEYNGLAQQYIKGDLESGSVYYTNSTHLNTGVEMPLATRIKDEGVFHPVIEAGAITHAWLGEASPDPEALKTFTIKMMKNTMNQQITYTRDLTYCKSCGKLQGGILDKCKYCGASQTGEWSKVAC